MAKHRCNLTGDLTLREGITQDQVREAFKGFLDWQGRSFEEAMATSDEITIEGNGALGINIPFSCYGYFRNEVEALAVALGAICAGEDWIEQNDPDTGDSEASVIPYFVGATPELRLAAQRKYGLFQAQTWLEPILGKEAFARVRDFAAGFPLQGCRCAHKKAKRMRLGLSGR